MFSFHSRLEGLLINSTEFRIAASGMAWKGSDSEGVTSMAATDIKWAQWIRVARNFQLRVGLKVGNEQRKETFDGFAREVRPYESSQDISAHSFLIFRITIG